MHFLVNSHQSTQPCFLNSTQFAVITSSWTRGYQLQLKGGREVCQLEGTNKLTTSAHLCSALVLRASFLWVMDRSCHWFCVSIKLRCLFPNTWCRLFTLMCRWCFMRRLYRSYVKSSYLPTLSFLLIPLRPLLARLSSKWEMSHGDACALYHLEFQPCTLLRVLTGAETESGDAVVFPVSRSVQYFQGHEKHPQQKHISLIIVKCHQTHEEMWFNLTYRLY